MNSSFRFHQSHFDTLATNIHDINSMHLILYVVTFVLFYWIIQIPIFVSYLIFFSSSLHLFHISFWWHSAFYCAKRRKNSQLFYRSCSWFIGCVSHSSYHVMTMMIIIIIIDDGHLWHCTAHHVWSFFSFLNQFKSVATLENIMSTWY